MNFLYPLSKVPLLNTNELREEIEKNIQSGYRVISIIVTGFNYSNFLCYMVLIDNYYKNIKVFSFNPGEKYLSLTPEYPQVHLFERELYENFKITPLEHPWLKPVRYISSREGIPDNAIDNNILTGNKEYFCLDYEEIHEVGVGPVHAGIIEPGHFRFLCHGEDVLHLEITLGYQFRGIEKNIIAKPKRALYYMETAAGDTTIGHSMAYAENMEALTNSNISKRAKIIRNIMLELERMANHIGDLGALAQDIGFLPTTAFCGRIRGDFLNLTASICGNRFGRSMIRTGGINFDIDKPYADIFLKKFDKYFNEAKSAISLLWNNPSVLARFENIGVLQKENCIQLGIVGVPAKASGINSDSRFKTDQKDYKNIQISLWNTGDVFARAMVRWLEIEQSYKYVKSMIKNLPQEDIYKAAEEIKKEILSLSITEGWRGEICHTAIVNANGEISAYKIVDPSFHNWTGLALSMRNQQISDFPLCNKSFNLSYCGHDL